MDVIHKMLRDVPIPKMARVRQFLPRPVVSDIRKTTQEELKRCGLAERLIEGGRIAITCGSRGISNIPEILHEVAAFCKAHGAEPFIFPAMGSHGGATAEGQRAYLEGLGVTEEACGCPILSSMETVCIGVSSGGHPVYIDALAAGADGILVVGRIKAHTAFRGTYESGLMKMMAVGMGKREGAEVCHSTGFRLIHEIIPDIGNYILEHAKVLAGIGIVENAFDETCLIRALLPEEIAEQEPILLEEAKKMMGKIHLEETDLLIVDRIGKNISGDGSDPNIAGNFCCEYASGGLNAKKRVVLDITEETQGNAMGVGLYDATTSRLFHKIDLEKTYVNPIVSTAINMAKIPPVMDCDRDAIAVCLKTTPEIDMHNPRVIRIQDTLHIEEIRVSSAHREEVLAHPQMELLEEFAPMEFLENGDLW